MLLPRSDITIHAVSHLTTLVFAPWTGTLFADLYGLNYPLEVEFFYLEHVLALLMIPLIMTL